jgi:tRNA1(Val) A37 N6-methylase TrmN6
VHGIDLREDAIARCRENIQANEWSERVSAVPYDVAASPGAGLSESFDWVMSNPPYLPASRMDQRKSDGAFDPATTETIPLAAWVSFMAGCAKDGGQLALVHRADRIEEVLAALAATCGDINIFPLWSKDDTAAKRIIVSARKAAHGPSCLHKGMVLHGKDGSFTSAAQAVLQDGAPLDLN